MVAVESHDVDFWSPFVVRLDGKQKAAIMISCFPKLIARDSVLYNNYRNPLLSNAYKNTSFIQVCTYVRSFMKEPNTILMWSQAAQIRKVLLYSTL